MEIAQPALEVVVVGRAKENTGHAADGDDREIPFGRFDLDRFGAIKFFALFVQQMTHRGFAGEPDAVVDIGHMERSFGLLRRGAEIDRVGGGIAQEDAGDIEKAEGLAGLADLRHDCFDGGRRGGEGDAQPRKWIGGRGRDFLAARTGKFRPVIRFAESAFARWAAALESAGARRWPVATIRTGTAIILPRCADRGIGRRGLLGPGRTEVNCAEIQRRGFFGHGEQRRPRAAKLTR